MSFVNTDVVFYKKRMLRFKKYRKIKKSILVENIGWQYIYDNFYIGTGELPEIHFQDCSIEDWKTWTNHINKKYNVQFKIDEDERVYDQIDFNYFKKLLEGNLGYGSIASIYLDHIQLNVFFISDTEIIHDFDIIREINNIQDHDNLMTYIQEICQLLDKHACIYSHGSEEIKHAEIDEREIIYFDINEMQYKYKLH